MVVLKDGKPSRILHQCKHDWRLIPQGDTFSLECHLCHTTIKAWKHLPRLFENVLDAISKLEPTFSPRKRWPKISVADLHNAVCLLNLPSRSRSERSRIWDVYNALCTLFSLKSGGSRGNLFVKSKILDNLIQVAMDVDFQKYLIKLCEDTRYYPARFKTMPLSSRKRYKFVLDAITLLPWQLSRDSFASSSRPLWAGQN
jgi:hypothetical protein